VNRESAASFEKENNPVVAEYGGLCCMGCRNHEIFSHLKIFVSCSRSGFSHLAILHPTRLISHPDAAEFLHFLCAKLGKIKVSIGQGMGGRWPSEFRFKTKVPSFTCCWPGVGNPKSVMNCCYSMKNITSSLPANLTLLFSRQHQLACSFGLRLF
jgi:hypothetical protein